MKRFGFSILILTMALLLGLANAQSAQSIKADVPFDFTAGDKTIPAGTVFLQAQGLTNGALWIANRDAKVNTYVVPMHTQALDPSERTVLVFHKYADRYFLARVDRSGSAEGYQLQQTKVEKELRAKNKNAGEEIRLAAN